RRHGSSIDGLDNGVRLLDVNNDGFMDVVIGNEVVMKTRLWNTASGTWNESATPDVFAGLNHAGGLTDIHPCFGVVRKDGAASLIAKGRAWHFEANTWREVPSLLNGLDPDTGRWGAGGFLRLRDFDHDGVCELLTERGIFTWSEKENR